MTIFRGSDDDEVLLASSIIESSLNINIEISIASILEQIDSSEILIIIAHGTEEGIKIDGSLISWCELVAILAKPKIDHIIILSCYSAMIYDYIEDGRRNIIGFKEAIDAVITANAISALINCQFGFVSDAKRNLKEYDIRSKELQEDPSKIVPLAWFKLSRKKWWIFPKYGRVWFKFTGAELKFNPTRFIIMEMVVFIAENINAIAGAALQLAEAIVELFLQISQSDHKSHGSDNAILSIEFRVLPVPLVRLNSHAYSESILAYAPITVLDPITASIGCSAIFSLISSKPSYKQWTWF
ncbi:MAG: hypothetical protein ACFFD2_07010 [Promethearchaeota archaeon]